MKYKSLLKYLTFFIFLQGCCCKKQCLGTDFSLKLQNFKKGETDSLKIIRYEAETGFKKAIDSFLMRSKPESDTIYLSHESNKNTELVVIKTNTKFQFSDFMYKKETCNFCLLGQDLYDKLSTYKINGKQTSTDSIASLQK